MPQVHHAIGVLDSGVGGLTVVREISRQLPHERIVYFGDTARMPYGPRSYDEVRRFALEIIEFLHTQDIKMVVVACNSATAAGLSHYQQCSDIPVLGVIEPGVRAALASTRNGRVGGNRHRGNHRQFRLRHGAAAGKTRSSDHRQGLPPLCAVG
jgi:glutamate racemase